MITLSNIKKHDDIIEADYYPEDLKDMICHIKVNYKTEEIVEHRGKKYVTCPTHATYALVRLAEHDNDDMPEKHVELWY